MPTLYDSDTKTYLSTSNRIDAEIGDSKEASSFLPRVKLKAWDNECNVSFGLVPDELKTAVVEEKDGKIIWAQDGIEAHFYELEAAEQREDGGVEFEIILAEKPESNSIPITLNIPKNLKFFYQGELTEEDVKRGCVRNCG